MLAHAGWTYRSESKDKFPSIPKILQIEQQRKFSPAGLCEGSPASQDVALLTRFVFSDPQRDSTLMTMAFGVPYSEHSSFFESVGSLACPLLAR